jgi:hypothetical protein
MGTKPATQLSYLALPLAITTDDRAVAYLRDAKGRLLLNSRRASMYPQMADLAKAANAYPRLVKTLRALTVLVETGMLINHPQACQERREEHAQVYDSAASLLRELGEDA